MPAEPGVHDCLRLGLAETGHFYSSSRPPPLSSLRGTEVTKQSLGSSPLKIGEARPARRISSMAGRGVISYQGVTSSPLTGED